MNEQKKSFNDYVNTNVAKTKAEATDLCLQMTSFVRNYKLNPNDWIFVDKLIKQLNKQNNVSRKVLRSVQNKFERIQDKYQR